MVDDMYPNTLMSLLFWSTTVVKLKFAKPFLD